MKSVANRPVLKLVEDKSLLKERLVQQEAQPDRCKRLVGELWSSAQHKMHSLHYVISYRESFKPELPDFCIRRFSKPGDVVFDPFCGRGTTVLQANLLGRIGWGSDANPLAVAITKAKSNPVALDEIVLRLNEVSFWKPVDLVGFQERFAPFYHPDTYRELLNLRAFIAANPDRVNRFIELLAMSRLHGHSAGFFSSYSSPHVAIPPETQRLVNNKRREVPTYRAVAPRIIKKAAQAVCDGISSDFFDISAENRIQESDVRTLHWAPSNSVDLIVTSPPLLDRVDYLTDNWIESWFTNVNARRFVGGIGAFESLSDWQEFMRDALRELLRVIKPQGYVVIEVGEVETRNGSVLLLDDAVAGIARDVTCNQKRFMVQEVLVNQQSSTKLANCFKSDDNSKGARVNRLVVLKCVNSRWYSQ